MTAWKPRRSPVAELLAAWESGDLAGLIEVMHPRATLTIDGGGTIPEVLPTTGALAAASALIAVRDELPGCTLAIGEVNGTPGIVIRSHDRVVGIVAVSAHGARVKSLWAVLNQAKLTHWNRG
ncbi:sigma-70 family RNA polymerase sigma factor family protein [Rathayibacter sp. CAU 1779]